MRMLHYLCTSDMLLGEEHAWTGTMTMTITVMVIMTMSTSLTTTTTMANRCCWCWASKVVFSAGVETHLHFPAEQLFSMQHQTTP